MTVALLGELLTANAAEKTLHYNLLKYGEEGRTSKGKVTVEKGTLEIPTGALPVNDEHNPGVQVGYMTASDAGDAVTATVQYFSTPEGDAAFEAANTGKRKGISVEVLNPIIRGGKMLAGLLVAAGVVKSPAFPSSMLLAADYGDIEPGVAEAAAALEAGDYAAAAAAIAAVQAKIAEEGTEDEAAAEPPAAAEDKKEEEEKKMTASTNALIAALAGAAKAKTPQAKEADKLTAAAKELTLAKFTDTLRSAAGDSRLTAAALDVVTQADMYDPTAQPAYLGELWNQTTYTERFAPLVSTENLTGLTVEGWRWEEGKSPIVDDWDPAFSGVAPAEQMNEIPTGEMVAKRYDFPAKRIAGGSRFDIANIHFPVPGVMESFLRMETEYIKKRRDARVQQHIYGNAKQITGTGNDVANPWRKIILGAMHCMDYAAPSYAIVGNDDYRELLGTDMLENLALLETTLGLESGSMAGFRIQPASITDTASNGKVIVGSSAATVLHEPAGAPFRVDAQELSRGAVDKAVFAYYLLRSDNRGGIYEVSAGV